MNNMLLAIDIIAGEHMVECTPADTTLSDKQRIFLAFLGANPDLQDRGSPVLYMQALSEAFPCSPKGCRFSLPARVKIDSLVRFEGARSTYQPRAKSIRRLERPG